MYTKGRSVETDLVFDLYCLFSAKPLGRDVKNECILGLTIQ